MPLTKFKIRWGYVIAFLLLLFSYFLIFFIIRKLVNQTDGVAHSYDVVNNLESIKSELIDAETGVRGYMLTKESRFLKPYHTGSANVLPLFEQLKTLTKDNINYKPSLEALNYLLAAKLFFLSDAVERFQKAGFKVSPEMVANRDNNKIKTDSIRLIISQLQQHEKQVMLAQNIKLRGFFSSTWLITITSLILALITIISSILVYNKENKDKEKAVDDARRYSAQLEQRVTELDKVNRQLEELKSLEKFTSTGRIARTIAHEVRNPLTNISLATEQLKEITGPTHETELLHDMISRNATRINQLVSDLLNSTRFAQLEHDYAEIDDIVNETLELASDRIDLNQIQVEKNYGIELEPVFVDREKIKLAFLNIIMNAIEAMPKGAGVLKISTYAQGSRVITEIRDNGTGMDEETISKLYEPYFTGKAKGNGLGLTNTQNIILNHKGNISVRSSKGSGSTFIVALNTNEEEVI